MSGIRRYHVDLGVPSGIAGPETGRALAYTVHAMHEAYRDHVNRLLPVALPAYALVEVETYLGSAIKWVVRTTLDATRDLVLVLVPNVMSKNTYIVKTVWVNRKEDRHATLDVSKYDRPGIGEAEDALQDTLQTHGG